MTHIHIYIKESPISITRRGLAHACPDYILYFTLISIVGGYFFHILSGCCKMMFPISYLVYNENYLELQGPIRLENITHNAY